MATNWIVERSYKVGGPMMYECANLDQLRQMLQDRADDYRPGPGAPPLGDLEFRYDLDEYERVNVVHAYFRDKHSIKQRFIRLRRYDL
jgi:hypothetical protein